MFKVLERIFKDKIATEQIALTGSDRLRGKIEGSCNSDCLNKCAKACPVKAFQVEGNDYKIDYKKCLFCGKSSGHAGRSSADYYDIVNFIH